MCVTVYVLVSYGFFAPNFSSFCILNASPVFWGRFWDRICTWRINLRNYALHEFQKVHSIFFLYLDVKLKTYMLHVSAVKQ